MPLRIILPVLALSAIIPCRAEKSPVFSEYAVRRVYEGPVKPPDFGDLRQYDGTDIRCFDPSLPFAREHVNFAGHFVIDSCTCGSGCHYLFMWDAQTGKFYRDLSFRPIDVGPYIDGAARVEYKGEQHVANSTLLIVDGCFEQTCDCGTHYYHWNGKLFEPLTKIPRLPPQCSK